MHIRDFTVLPLQLLLACVAAAVAVLRADADADADAGAGAGYGRYGRRYLGGRRRYTGASDYYGYGDRARPYHYGRYSYRYST